MAANTHTRSNREATAMTLSQKTLAALYQKQQAALENPPKDVPYCMLSSLTPTDDNLLLECDDGSNWRYPLSDWQSKCPESAPAQFAQASIILHGRALYWPEAGLTLHTDTLLRASEKL